MWEQGFELGQAGKIMSFSTWAKGHTCVSGVKSQYIHIKFQKLIKYTYICGVFFQQSGFM